MADETPVRPATGDRLLLGLLAGIGLVILAALAVAVWRGPRRTATFDPASPQGVVQSFVQDVREGQMDEAGALLTRRARQSDAWQQVLKQDWRGRSSHSARQVDLQSASVTGDRAQVVVVVTHYLSPTSEPGVFWWLNSGRAPGGYESRITFTLLREDGAWRIDAPFDHQAFSIYQVRD